MFRQRNSHTTETVMAFHLTLEEYEASTGGEAYCIDCGEAYGEYLEPDASEVQCQSCDNFTVYGIQEILIMGLVS